MVWVEMPRKTPGPPCTVCQQPSVAKGLCDKHYRRWSNYGDTTATLRPKDWGKRSSHPLYGSWMWTRRSGGRVEAWDDFWAFAADVGDRPSPSHWLRRHREKEPWGPGNFFWKQSLTGTNYTTTTAEGKCRYQRDWRAANRLRAKHHNLKKSYGISLEEYAEMLDFQAGVCAICLGHDRAFAHLAVDHCHATGKIRGLLCNQCNRALGSFKDDPARLRRALIYLTGSLVAPT